MQKSDHLRAGLVVKPIIARIHGAATRVIGFLNILYALAGLLYFMVMARWHWAEWSNSRTLTQWAVLVILATICIALTAWLGYFGARQVKGDESVAARVFWVMCAVLVYSVADVLCFWVIMPISSSAVSIGFWEMAEGPLVPQIITRYPLWRPVAVGALWLTRSGRMSEGNDGTK